VDVEQLRDLFSFKKKKPKVAKKQKDERKARNSSTPCQKKRRRTKVALVDRKRATNAGTHRRSRGHLFAYPYDV